MVLILGRRVEASAGSARATCLLAGHRSSAALSAIDTLFTDAVPETSNSQDFARLAEGNLKGSLFKYAVCKFKR